MKDIFDLLINSFVDDRVGIADHFLSPGLASSLKRNLTAFYDDKMMLPAGTGNDTLVVHDTLFRSDKIWWLDRANNNLHENAFFDLMDSFVGYLNSTCYSGITGYEFHYALYEQGSFYKKHIDQFSNNNGRKYSMVMYLNEGWQDGHGGELCLYHEGRMQTISPENGKTVFFKSSEMPHEVLLANKPRMSITGWLKA